MYYLLVDSRISCRAEQYQIVTTWDNRTIDHPDRPVIIWFEKHNDSFFNIYVDGPFFNDPPSPNGQVGEPFFKLWDYEGIYLMCYFVLL